MMATSGFSLPGRRIDGRRFLEVANDLLVFRRFDDVLKMCRVRSAPATNGQRAPLAGEVVFPHTLRGVGRSLLGRDTDPGDEEIVRGKRADKIWQRKFDESVCILAIQAYAETDQWTSVHPFLKQYYGHQAKYPLSIVKLCILLHAKVHDFPAAETLAVEWLSDASNQTHAQYSSVLELLITHVLLPQTKLQEAKALVELNPGLSPEKKMGLLKYLDKVEEEQKLRTIAKTDEESTQESPGSSLVQFVQRLGQLITRLVPVSGLRYIRDIACISFFVYLIVVRTNLASSSSMSHAAVLWSGIVRIWRSLFAPFHLMPKA